MIAAPRRFAFTIAPALLLSLASVTAVAQPGNKDGNRFGDRQVGQWGDPSQGHFGNPAVGSFDNSKIREPALGTRPLGSVQNGRNAPVSPYVSLPQPRDAVPEVAPQAATQATGAKPAKKAPAKKKSS